MCIVVFIKIRILSPKLLGRLYEPGQSRLLCVRITILGSSKLIVAADGYCFENTPNIWFNENIKNPVNCTVHTVKYSAKANTVLVTPPVTAYLIRADQWARQTNLDKSNLFY